MPHRGIRFAQWFALLFAAVTAFLFLTSLDQDGVLGPNHLVLVSDSDRRTPSEAVLTTVTEVATAHRATIARWTPDLREPDRVRHLYMATGDPASEPARWLGEGYPWFSRDVQTTIHPLADIGRTDPQGYYLIFGDAAARDDLATRIRDLGYRVETREYLTAEVVAKWALTNPAAKLVALVVLFIVALVGSDVVTRTRAYGVQRLQGAAWLRIMQRDLVAVAPSGLAAVGVIAATSIAALAWYNGLHQLAAFGAVAGVLVAAFAAIGLATHAAALALAHRVALVDALKGRLPTGGLIVATYVVRLASVSLTLLLLTSSLASLASVRQADAENTEWASAANASFAQFSGDLASEETEARVLQAGRWLKREAAQGHAVLVQKDVWNELVAGDPALGRESLLVDSTYLQRHPVLLTDGSRATAQPGVVQVLVPEGWQDRQDQVRHQIEEWARASGGRTQFTPTVRVATLKAEQRLFTYGASQVRTMPALYSDPLVIVADSELKFLSDDDTMAFASGGGIVLLDQNQAVASSNAAGLQTFIYAFAPVAMRAQLRAAELAAELRVQLFGLAGSLLLLFVSGWGIAELHVRRNAQALFARFIHGWSFWQANRGVVTTEVGLAALVVGFVTWSTITALADASTSSFRHPDVAARLALGGWEPWAALAIAAATAGVFLLACAHLTRRLIHHHASEA